MTPRPPMISTRVAHFWASPTLRVLAIVGDPDAEDARALIRGMQAELQDETRRYASLVDVRRLGRIGEEPLAMFVRFALAAKDRLARAVLRSAVVHRDNLAGSIAAGYTRLLGDPFPVRAFADLREAAIWLELGAGEAAALEETLGAVASNEDELSRLRAHLRSAPRATLASAAKALGVSTRHLQRHLKSAGTSLRQEIAVARVDAAKDRLARTNDKILAIALDLGFTKSEPLVRAFRAHTGVGPAEWREAERRRGAFEADSGASAAPKTRAKPRPRS
jgi:AraC-like DNA-binding protein